MGLLLITHDLGVVNEITDRVLVMYNGNLVEEGDRVSVLGNPQHEYTQHLLNAIPEPRTATKLEEGEEAPNLVEVKGLKVWFPIRAGLLQRAVDHVRAVDGVDLSIRKGETMALVGESGSGKTTMGKALSRLLDPTGGTILYDGVDITTMNRTEFRPWRQRIQVIFQDPASSLDPRMFVRDIIGEGLRSFGLPAGREYEEVIADLLVKVGLDAEMMHRYPHEFSGGQRQRICIARALAVEPEFVVCDEATSALDVSVQAGVLELLQALQAEMGLTYLFITHDLSVVRHIADRVTVMHRGSIVEEGETQALFDNPQKEYTRRLLTSAPSMDPSRRVLNLHEA